jgi:glycosyltransferase involved in cell wall biosynthesis
MNFGFSADEPSRKVRARPRLVLSVNARTADRRLHAGSSEHVQRRTDFGALQEATGARVVDWDSVDARALTRWLRRRFGFGPAAAALLFSQRKDFDVAWCFSEVEGLLLALLLKFSRTRRHVFVIGVELLSWKCLVLLRVLRVWAHLSALLPTNTYQAGELVRRARAPQGKVVVLPYQVDCQYFSPPPARPVATAPYVVAVGLESRDFATLAEAVEGLDVEVKVAAGSLWAGRARGLEGVSLPPNVTVGSYSYDELRQLYAGAALAVVPLAQSVYQHGVTAVQEAMAMGLAVVVTRTIGQGDVVVDRRKRLRAHPPLGTTGGFAEVFAPGRADLARPNGHYVPVGDAAALRRSIVYLLSHKSEREALGAQGRFVAEQLLSVDSFVSRAQRLIDAAWAGEPLTQGLLSASF